MLKMQIVYMPWCKKKAWYWKKKNLLLWQVLGILFRIQRKKKKAEKLIDTVSKQECKHVQITTTLAITKTGIWILRGAQYLVIPVLLQVNA